ncbi:hypothetical protein VRK_18880 [Vibrio sp. MEBiC08052]|nr:hypothetical protein VRK_18880 [Vibrio sp. MEBiC08052]
MSIHGLDDKRAVLKSCHGKFKINFWYQISIGMTASGTFFTNP